MTIKYAVLEHLYLPDKMKIIKSLGLILILTITSHSKPPLFSDSSKCHFLYGLEIGYNPSIIKNQK